MKIELSFDGYEIEITTNTKSIVIMAITVIICEIFETLRVIEVITKWVTP